MKHDADDSNYFPESCRTDDNKAYYSASMTVFLLSFLLFYLVSMMCWLRKRNHFPIKERSPYLVFITMMILLLQSIINPLYYDMDSFLTSPEDLSDPEKTLNLTQELIILVTFCLRLVVYWPIMLRTARIIYVFNCRGQRKALDYIFQREPVLVGMVIVIFIIIFLISLVSNQCFLLGLSTDSDDDCESGIEFVWVIYLLITITLFIVLTYYSRDIHKEYNFQTEMIIMCGLEGFYNQLYSLIVLFWPNYMAACLGNGPFSNILIVENLRGLTLTFIVVWMPLKLTSRKLIPLAPSVACESVEFFLADEKLFGVFFKYLEHLKRTWALNQCDEKSCCSGPNDSLISSKAMKANALDYLRFKYDIFIAEKEPEASRKNAMYVEIFKTFFTHGSHKLFPDKLLKKLDQNTQLSAENDLNILKFSFSDFEDFLDVADEIINHIFFAHFKKTNSFSRVFKLMARNDLINSRIIQFKLTSL